MNQLTKALETINLQREAIIEEAKGKGNSGIVNIALRDKYPTLTTGKKSSKAMLLAIWTPIINKAPKKFSRSWQALFKALNTLLYILYDNESTRESTLTGFRKLIRERTNDKTFDMNIYTQSTYLMGVSQSRSKERKEEYTNKVKARNVNRGSLVGIFIEQIYKIIDKLIQSNNPYELSIAVLLATGSRSIELFKVSTYEETNDVYRIRVIGIAKDRGTNSMRNVVLIRNLVRLTAKQVIDVVHKIRTTLKTENLSNEKISSKTNTPLNKKFKEHIIPIFIKNARSLDQRSESNDRINSEEFKTQLSKLTSHKTRYIGGNASYQIYGKPKSIPESVYLQEQYGHLSGESTKSYLSIIVKFENETLADGTTDLQPLENRIMDLEGKVEECCDERVTTPIKKQLNQFTNSFSKSESQASKVEKVKQALTLLKSKKIKMKQDELRDILRFSGQIMTLGYKAFRGG